MSVAMRAARRDDFPSLLAWLYTWTKSCRYADVPVSVWQAEEAVANLPLRLAVRVHCGHQVWWGTLGALEGLVRAAHGVLMVYSRGIPQSVSHGTIRSEECAAVRLQGLELLVAVLLARSRQPPPTVAAGAPHAELAAELVSLPSGVLAMVCEAIVKLMVRLASCLCVHAWAIGEGRRGLGACTAAARVLGRGVSEALQVVNCSSGFRRVPVRDAEGSRAADAGAPPWHGATWAARMRSAKSDIRCPMKTSDPIMAARPHSAAEFGRIREQVLVVVLQRTVLGLRARSKLERRAQ
jgi:hypothetical protein